MGRNPVLICTSSILVLIFTFPLLAFSYSNRSPYDWPEANPEDYGFITSNLENAYSIADNMTYLRSVLVIRHGMLLVEWYFNDGSKYSAFHIHSASKSFTSALIGIAFRERLLESVNQKLVEFFPEYFTPDIDQRKWNITIRHLLQMTAGFNFNESTDDWIAYSSSENWVKYAIELPLLHSPGEDWHYSTPQTNLLAAILARVANVSARDFAKEYLFDPLGISISHWHQDPQGYYTGGHEMYFVPRDMARLGYLYLNNGTIDGEQIIPMNWVRDSLIDFRGDYHYQYLGYGYQWWLQKLVGYDTYSARGLGGQNIFCVPELDMVVVTTATGSIFDYNPNQPGEITDLVRDILQAVDPDFQITTTNTNSTTTTFDNDSLNNLGISVILLGSIVLIGTTVIFLRKRNLNTDG